MADAAAGAAAPAGVTSSVGSFKKREEEAKKKQSGELPPDVDEHGKMINPHNPDFITKVPWYLGSSGPTLKHHSIQKEDHVLSMAETDAIIAAKLQARQKLASSAGAAAPAPAVFKKGACRNCGSTTHKQKDCVERPRSNKLAAWKSGLDIAPSDAAADSSVALSAYGKVSFDAKRDQWAGYDPAEHRETVSRYERLEAERRRQAKEERQAAMHRALLKGGQEGATAEGGGEVEGESTGQRGGGGGKRRVKFAGGSSSAAKDKSKGAGSDSGGFSESDSDSDSDSDAGSSGEDSDSGGSDGEGGQRRGLSAKEFKERDEKAVDFQARQARQGGVGGAQMKTTVRNLRIREDTPKYLRNLALDSAHYDPKSRSMRANPLPDANPDDLVFAGDNFVRHTGDALKLAQTQVLCWDMQTQAAAAGAAGAGAGNEGVGEGGTYDSSRSEGVIDLLSNPSQAEHVMRQWAAKKAELDAANKQAILSKYGSSSSGGGDMGGRVAGQDAVNKALADPRLRLGQTEAYAQYGADGRVVKGPAAPSNAANRGVVRRSKYEEDVLTNNHRAVWGSYFHRGQRKWGYACCHSLLHNSYCTGELGRAANDSANGGSAAVDASTARKLLEFQSKKNAGGEGDNKGETATAAAPEIHPNSTRANRGSAATDAPLDPAKLKEALKRADEQLRRGKGEGDDDRKRSFNSAAQGSDGPDGHSVSAEDVEAWKMKRLRTDDPMFKLMDAAGGGEDVLLEYEK